jgi:hypothetical protein
MMPLGDHSLAVRNGTDRAEFWEGRVTYLLQCDEQKVTLNIANAMQDVASRITQRSRCAQRGHAADPEYVELIHI